MAKPPTGKVTFFFTDIQGSTAMWERDAKRMQHALARHDQIMKGTVEDHGGFVFKMVGDACCAAFASAPEALEAALAAQRAIFEEPWDERSRVRVRMALHTGEAEERDGDYFGPPVNRVARLLSAGHGGQTLLSGATRGEVDDHLPEGVSVRDMGERRLKDLKDPERIFQLLAPGLPSEFPPLKTLETSSNEDRYRLIRRIGSGGMAEVYLAYDEFLGREVAFKVLDRKYAENKEAIERFRREAKNAASLHHPNIVATHDRGETEDGTYYIVMEYLEGGTLEDLIAEAGSLPPREAAEIAVEIADALGLAHEGGVIHRDIKPQNILLSKGGEAKVADFGIARAASATTMTQAGSILGTVHYISPEQALGETATPRSDLYSLGVVLYEMLTGELPYDAETPVGVVMKHVSGLTRSPKDVNADVPEELDALVSRLLARDPEDRYPDAATLTEDLERIIEGLPAVPEAERARGADTAGGRGARTTRSGTSGRRLRTGTGGMGARSTRAPDGRRQRVGVLVAMMLVLASIGVIGFVAFGRGGLLAETKTLPEIYQLQQNSEALPPGRYTTDEFDPTLSFTVAENSGWRLASPDTPGMLEITPAESLRGNYPALTFLGAQAQEVFAPNSQHMIALDSEDRTTPAPGDMITWLRNHPSLETSEPEPVTVGGHEGVLLNISVSPGLENYSVECGPFPCVFLMKETDEVGFALWADQTNRLIVLEDVEGETVILAASGPKDGFARFAPKVERLLSTVQFGDARAWFGAPETDLPSGFGSGGGTDTPTQTLPTEGEIEPGAYRTDEFEVPFSFRVGEGWEVPALELPDALDILLADTQNQPIPSGLGFAAPKQVIDPRDSSMSTLVAAPDTVQGWVEWLQEHPDLKTDDPVPATVEGISGQRVDITSERETGLWQLSDQSVPAPKEGERWRVIVLEVKGETVLIGITSSADRFEGFLPKAQEVLDTVEWKTSPTQ